MVVHRLAVLVDEPRRRPKLLVKPIALRGRAIVGRCVALHRRVGRARVAAIRIRAGGHWLASGCHRNLIARKSAAAMQTAAKETQSGARADCQHKAESDDDVDQIGPSPLDFGLPTLPAVSPSAC